MQPAQYESVSTMTYAHSKRFRFNGNDRSQRLFSHCHCLLSSQYGDAFTTPMI